MADKGVQFDAATAKRLVKAMRLVEKHLRPTAKKKRRVPKAGGYLAVMRYRLTEQLLAGASAAGVRTIQDPDDGTWSDLDTVEEDIYDDLLPTGTALEIDDIAYVFREPSSGLLNLLQTKNCPTAPE